MYLREVYPLKMIYRLITCNQPSVVSPQCRIMRLESYRANSVTEVESRMRFVRTDEACLRQNMTWILPLSIHIIGLVTLHLTLGTTDATRMLTNKRKVDDDGTEDTSLLRPQSLNMTEHRDFVHFVPIMKELVFDLDVHDFDRFCPCVAAKRKTLCGTCWLHMEGAYLIMHFMLTHLFGYNSANILTVFSGGKGLHFFVNDIRAMTLTESQRFFIHEVMSIPNQIDTPLSEWIHRFASPDLSHRLEALFTNTVLQARDLFVTSPGFRHWFEQTLLRYYPATHSNLTKTDTWLNPSTPSHVIWQLLKTLEIYDYHTKTRVKPSLFIIYRLYFPVIDKAPLELSHSIKLPFSIHTTTRHIALPINLSFIENPDKSSLVSLENVCAAHVNSQPLPSLFTTGITLLEDWLNTYSSSVAK